MVNSTAKSFCDVGPIGESIKHNFYVHLQHPLQSDDDGHNNRNSLNSADLQSYTWLQVRCSFTIVDLSCLHCQAVDL